MTSLLSSSNSNGERLQTPPQLTLCLPPCSRYPNGAQVVISLVLICIPLKVKGAEHVVRLIDHLCISYGKIPIQVLSPFLK